MKRIIAVVLVLVLLFTLFGACAVKTAEKTEKEETEETQSSKSKDKTKDKDKNKDKDEDEDKGESSGKSGKSGGLGSLFGKKVETTPATPAESSETAAKPAETEEPAKTEEPETEEPEKPAEETPVQPAEPDNTDSAVIKIGYDRDYPPYTYEENGVAKGFDIDLAKAVCEAAGLTPEFVPMDWEEKEDLLKDGSIDCVWSAFSSGYGDDAIYIESVDYYNDCTVLITAAGSGIQDRADISSVAVLDGEKTEYYARDYWSDVRVFAEDEYDELCQALMSGEVDAVAVLFRTAVAMYGEYYDELFIFDDYLNEQYYCVAFYITETGLREKIDQGLFEVLASFEAFSIACEYDLENGLIYYD